MKENLNFWVKFFIQDPLFNNGLVRNNPTPRQEQILSQLASLKQVNIHYIFKCEIIIEFLFYVFLLKSLYQKQKEVASSIAIENNEDFDMTD